MSRQCDHPPSKWIGVVTNQPESVRNGTPSDKARSYMGHVTCGRSECIDAAKRWVTAKSHETAVLVLYSEVTQ